MLGYQIRLLYQDGEWATLTFKNDKQLLKAFKNGYDDCTNGAGSPVILVLALRWFEPKSTYETRFEVAGVKKYNVRLHPKEFENDEHGEDGE